MLLTVLELEPRVKIMIIAPDTQDDFDITVGRLGHVISLLRLYGKNNTLGEANRQTLRHQALSMISAGEAILKDISAGGSPQE